MSIMLSAVASLRPRPRSRCAEVLLDDEVDIRVYNVYEFRLWSDILQKTGGNDFCFSRLFQHTNSKKQKQFSSSCLHHKLYL
jgi:hypothetical protein